MVVKDRQHKVLDLDSAYLEKPRPVATKGFRVQREKKNGSSTNQ